ncbi:MAG: hypothetical protein QOJ70_1894 [Acidobacteriota bacterium]|jgi:WD40 repeat protein|nr:hypothetical protein [Acidobacteriota bacterium]
MIAARKFESFCIDPGERWIFAGNISGQLSVIDIDEFRILHETQAHAGGIQAVAAHPQLPYVAALATDRSVSVWSYDEAGELRRICSIPLRNIKPVNDEDEVPYVQSTSQALGFHDSQRRIVTRSGNAGLVELEFTEDGAYSIVNCARIHRDADLISVRFAKNSDLVLSGSIDGEFVLSERGQLIRRWDVGHNVHWAEHLSDTTYLLASDRRCVARVDINEPGTILIGESFTRDDLEHVTYNRSSGRAFVGSFDRTIYEIDTESCAPTRVAFEPPFKCRWVKTLERSPSTLLIQCRNGGLYKASVDTGACLGVIKQTPDALWTAINAPDGSLLLSGEGESLVRIEPQSCDPLSRAPVFSVGKSALGMRPDSYTKRMVRQASTGLLVLGRTNGDVVVVEDDEVKRVWNVGSAVRDLEVAPSRPDLFAACEDGHVYKLDLETGEVKLSFESTAGQPFWSLAYNPWSNALAVGERGGALSVLDADDFAVVTSGLKTSRTKRMKWADADTLLYNKQDELHKIDFRSGERAKHVGPVGNTIEDFIWDEERRYLVMISYTCNLLLCDYESGEVINEVPDQMDYSKGLIWIDPQRRLDAYPFDFITFGRSGSAHHFRIHDEKILALGPIRNC